MDATFQSELGEFIAIPSVSADPAHRYRTTNEVSMPAAAWPAMLQNTM